MLREKAFVMILAALAAGGVLMGYFRQRPETVQYRLSQELSVPSSRSAEGRRWSRVELGPTPVKLAGEPLLSAVVAGDVDPQGDVFVLDLATSSVEELSSEGEHLRSYRWSPGEDEFELKPIDFAVGGSGDVWIAYANHPLVNVIDPEGRATTYELETPAHRIAVGPDGSFAVMALRKGPYLFRSYGPEGELRRDFGHILDGDLQDPTLLDGAVASGGDGTFVYAPYYIGILASYTIEGKQRFVVPTVGSDSASLASLPKVLVQPNGWRKLAAGTPWKSLAVHVADGKIYVMSEREKKATKRRILDVYGSEDGRYLQSIRLPDGPRDFMVDGDVLHTVHAEGVLQWRLIEDVASEPS